MSNKPKHTEGPWRAVESIGDWYVVDKDENNVAAFTACYPEGAISLDEFDAKLIAAAPELYEALKELVPMQGCIDCQEGAMPCDTHGNINETIRKAKQALAKAEGKGGGVKWGT